METLVCPRRYGRTDGLPDRWEAGRWDSAHYVAKWPNGFDKPRTCSFCGGAHPDDLIALLRAGWEVGTTTKDYKRYMHPPGYRLNHERMMSHIQARKLDQPFDSLGYVDPLPPVKLYTPHFNQEQVDEFNRILEVRYRDLDATDCTEPS